VPNLASLCKLNSLVSSVQLCAGRDPLLSKSIETCAALNLVSVKSRVCKENETKTVPTVDRNLLPPVRRELSDYAKVPQIECLCEENLVSVTKTFFPA